MIKKIFAILVSLGILFSLFPKNSFAEKEDYFIVTAYYSPLANQEYYMMWDYESEKILQWNWTNWASWKEVFSGMLAAPAKYSFWTKIYLEWIWVWVVEDRGWAIVRKGKRWAKYDRIDIWMWYGDEWLKRALAWGKRTVKWKIVSRNTKTTFNYKTRIAPDWAVRWLKSVREKETIFDYDIWKDSPKEKIKNLQKFLAKIWVYKWEIDWNYMWETIDIIFDFQIANSIVSSEKEAWAGYWWTKTRALFKKMYLNWEFRVWKIDKKLNKEIKLALEKEEKIKNEQISLLKKEKDKNLFSSFSKSEEEIKKSLEVMKILEIYNWETNLSYEEFIEVVYDFQVSNSIVKTEYDKWAWYFWPKTRNKLKNLYFDYIDKKIKKEENLFLEKKEKILEKQRKEELKQKYENLEKDILGKTADEIKKISFLKKWDVSENVRNLQKTLKKLWYFHYYKTTKNFWNITKKALADFQMEHNLIDSYDSKYAGILWERTLEKLAGELYLFYYEELLGEETI